MKKKKEINKFLSPIIKARNDPRRNDLAAYPT